MKELIRQLVGQGRLKEAVESSIINGLVLDFVLRQVMFMTCKFFYHQLRLSQRLELKKRDNSFIISDDDLNETHDMFHSHGFLYNGGRDEVFVKRKGKK